MTPTTGIASESGHWYQRDGQPAYELPTRDGRMRPVNLRDARTMQLVPSVTTILKCAAAPGLEEWKQTQTLMAALTLPRGAEESEACWLDRIRHDSREQARLAAERGTEIHAAIEAYFEMGWTSTGQFYWRDPAIESAVAAVAEQVNDRFGYDACWYAEQSFAHPLGFGGKADLLSHPTTVDVLIDFKTKSNEDILSGKRLGYDEHLMQLAAYREGLGRPEALCVNVYVGREEPWPVRMHEWSEDDLRRGWLMFLGLLDYWRAKNRLDPSWEVDEA